MNHVTMVGRLVKDPEIRYTQGENTLCIASFSLALDRKYKREGETNADFPNCVAFGKTAEFIEKYFFKGMRMGAEGRIQTRNYENGEGKRVYVTEVVVESVEFVENKQEGQQKRKQPEQETYDGFMNIPDGFDEELPFK